MQSEHRNRRDWTSWLWHVRGPGRRRSRDLLVPAVMLFVRSVVAAFWVLTLRAPVHMRQYIMGALLTISLLWIAVMLYIVLTPRSYSSHWAFILPTASSGSSVNVDTIGNAQSTSSSPFGSITLSPKVIYKEIIASERVRAAAAVSLGLTMKEFGSPQIKLIDETSLLLIEMRGYTPEDAQGKANALISAFNNQLDALRNDELQRRADVVQTSLKTYRQNLEGARERILDQQRTSGVLSINQFNEASTSLELMRRRLGEVRAEYAKLTAEQQLLIDNLGLDQATAMLLLQISGDPSFYKLANDFAEANAQFREDSIRMGPANPILALSRNRATAARQALHSAITTMTGAPPAKLEKLSWILNGSQRADLIRQLLLGNGAVAGKREELASLERELERLDADVKRMSGAVSRLEDLKKDHLIAEAVFTSALARLDTNKVDIYASYPLVQTLAEPDLPEVPTSPYVLIAVLAGILGSLLATAAWGMAWLRHMFGMRRSAKVRHGTVGAGAVPA